MAYENYRMGLVYRNNAHHEEWLDIAPAATLEMLFSVCFADEGIDKFRTYVDSVESSRLDPNFIAAAIVVPAKTICNEYLNAMTEAADDPAIFDRKSTQNWYHKTRLCLRYYLSLELMAIILDWDTEAPPSKALKRSNIMVRLHAQSLHPGNNALNSIKELKWLAKILVALPNYYHEICKSCKSMEDFPQWLWNCHDDEKLFSPTEFHLGCHSPALVCQKLMSGELQFPDYVVQTEKQNFTDKTLPKKKRGAPSPPRRKKCKQKKQDEHDNEFDKLKTNVEQCCHDNLNWILQHIDSTQQKHLHESIQRISTSVARSVHDTEHASQADKNSASHTDDSDD